MNLNEQTTSRREFFRTLPQALLKAFRLVVQQEEEGDSSTFTQPRAAILNVDRCLAWAGANCQFCYLACPRRDEAIVMSDLKPVIFPTVCDGCGMCEVACRTVNDTPAINID